MSKFTIGDEVRVKSDLEGGEFYGEIYLLEVMKTSEILTVIMDCTDRTYLCNNGFFYSEEMLEPACSCDDSLVDLINKEIVKAEKRRDEEAVAGYAEDARYWANYLDGLWKALHVIEKHERKAEK